MENLAKADVLPHDEDIVRAGGRRPGRELAWLDALAWAAQ